MIILKLSLICFKLNNTKFCSILYNKKFSLYKNPILFHSKILSLTKNLLDWDVSTEVKYFWATFL